MDLRNYKWAKKDRFKHKTLTGPRLGSLLLFLLFFGFFILYTYRNGFDTPSIVFLLSWLPTGYLAFCASDETIDAWVSFLVPFSM